MEINTIRRRAKGLVTVALLKTFFDHGQGLVGTFRPLILDVLATLPVGELRPEEFKAVFREREGIEIPLPVVGTLLRSAQKEGAVRREAGRYFRTGKPVKPTNFEKVRAEIEGEQRWLAKRLEDYASQSGRSFEPDTALDLLIDFLEENQVAFLLDSPMNLTLSRPQS